MLTVRRATRADAEYLAPRLREADVNEVRAGGSEPLPALLSGLEHSLEPLVGVDPHGDPFCMFGVAPSPDPLVGCIWLLGTDAVRKYPLGFNRHCKAGIARFHEHFPVLMNCVDERNTVHIEWLRWHGFTFLRRLPIGIGGLPFLEFARLHHV